MSNKTEAPTSETNPSEKPVCGVVMPISEIDGLPASHWKDVYSMLATAIANSGFEPNLVSTSDEVGIIQKTIVQNLYDNPIVVCDVSGKNPNVMFELGMRLAFDRPTIIVKDDKTSYSFDTSPIQHLGYPRDLRFNLIDEFQTKLTVKIQTTQKKALEDPNFSTFLKHFGEFKVAKIDKTEVSGQEFIIGELQNLKAAMIRLERSSPSTVSYRMRPQVMSSKAMKEFLASHPGRVRVSEDTSGLKRVDFITVSESDVQRLEKAILKAETEVGSLAAD